GARSYDPELGRFISEDPLGLSAGINPYAYVGNSPVNGTDPSGMCEWVKYVFVDQNGHVVGTQIVCVMQGLKAVASGSSYGGRNFMGSVGTRGSDWFLGALQGAAAAGGVGGDAALSTAGAFRAASTNCGHAIGDALLSAALDGLVIASAGTGIALRGAALGGEVGTAFVGDVTTNLARGWSVADAVAPPAALIKAAGLQTTISSAVSTGVTVVTADPAIAEVASAKTGLTVTSGHGTGGTLLRLLPVVGTVARIWDAFQACTGG
ncbi:MAG: RHS repeat-associated core domain-containing protein, partial [Candidatus Palauibacterales bacterium]|nr:RHS repeat-associated core domain-containing protein [Candidatus Palauibacterales bacterium]